MKSVQSRVTPAENRLLARSCPLNLIGQLVQRLRLEHFSLRFVCRLVPDDCIRQRLCAASQDGRDNLPLSIAWGFHFRAWKQGPHLDGLSNVQCELEYRKMPSTPAIHQVETIDNFAKS
jgi:hypothetical protein